MICLNPKSGAAANGRGQPEDGVRCEFRHGTALGAYQMVVRMLEIAEREARRAAVVHLVHQACPLKRLKRPVDGSGVEAGKHLLRLLVHLGDRRVATQMRDGLQDDASLGRDPQAAPPHRLAEFLAATHAASLLQGIASAVYRIESDDVKEYRQSRA
jgi:hypothetical protein